MSISCRFCTPDCEQWEMSSAVAMMGFQDCDEVLDGMLGIESLKKIIPGITSWCCKCRGFSILSHTAYVALMCAHAKTADVVVDSAVWPACGVSVARDWGGSEMEEATCGGENTDCAFYYAEIVQRYRAVLAARTSAEAQNLVKTGRPSEVVVFMDTTPCAWNHSVSSSKIGEEAVEPPGHRCSMALVAVSNGTVGKKRRTATSHRFTKKRQRAAETPLDLSG